jgi:hypothetical protein
MKPATIRTILSLATVKNWHIKQLDVKNAFLHGELTKEVFLHQPQGFVDLGYPGHIYKLRKALYGLKQAPKAWF